VEACPPCGCVSFFTRKHVASSEMNRHGGRIKSRADEVERLQTGLTCHPVRAGHDCESAAARKLTFAAWGPADECQLPATRGDTRRMHGLAGRSSRSEPSGLGARPFAGELPSPGVPRMRPAEGLDEGLLWVVTCPTVGRVRCRTPVVRGGPPGSGLSPPGGLDPKPSVATFRFERPVVHSGSDRSPIVARIRDRRQQVQSRQVTPGQYKAR